MFLVRLVRLAFLGANLVKFRSKVQFRPALPEVMLPTPTAQGATTAKAPTIMFQDWEHAGDSYDVHVNKKNP